jgi:acetolactate synthase I/II/III large subunit
LSKLIPWLADRVECSQWSSEEVAEHRQSELSRLLSGPAAGSQAGIAPTEVVEVVRRMAPPGTIATVDSGAHMLPTMILWSAESVEETLISSSLATMGYALPAAVGASVARPDRRVIAFTGDGGLGMCLNELETLARYFLPVTVVVFNDSALSLIAVKAKPLANGGTNATTYGLIDYAQLAAAQGIRGLAAQSGAELEAAMSACLDSDGPSLIDVRVDPASYRHILDALRGRRPRVARRLRPEGR